MRLFNKIIRLLSFEIKKNEKIMLGRWNLIYDDTKLENRIKLANEDNCGVCYDENMVKKYINNNNN